MIDPIANMLTTIRNGQAVGKEAVKVPYSNFKLELAKLLEQEKFIVCVEKSGRAGKRYLDITLAYDERRHGAIQSIARISKPGQRMYYGYRDFHQKPGVIQIVSTPKGLMVAGRARKEKIGGELICELR